MKNVEMKVNGTSLEIKVDLTKDFGTSSSGKSCIIASTEGNQAVVGAEHVKVGLNIYTPVNAEKGIAGELIKAFGQNIEAELGKDKKTLTMKCDISKDFGTSSSGKSKVIASSGGNVSIGLGNVKVGLNVYSPIK